MLTAEKGCSWVQLKIQRCLLKTVNAPSRTFAGVLTFYKISATSLGWLLLVNAPQRRPPVSSEYLLCITNSCFRFFTFAVNGRLHFSSMTVQGRNYPSKAG
jgi:hypothetical protein